MGAMIGVLPDLALLSFKRREEPNELYRLAHSFAGMGIVVLAFHTVNPMMVALCYISHLILDIFTHGRLWSPRLLWPANIPSGNFEEWEWFNDSWMNGLVIAVTWSIVCLLLTRTGFHWLPGAR